MRKSLYIIIGVIVLLLASCGQRYDAKKTVGRFIDEYAVAPDKFLHKDFSKLDSTRLISDSVLQALRTKANADGLYHDIRYSPPTGAKLLIIRLKFDYDTLHYHQTFYLDEQAQNVVAFKGYHE